MTSKLNGIECYTSWLHNQFEAFQNKADHLQLQLHDENKEHAQEKIEAALVHQQLKGDLGAVLVKQHNNEKLINEQVHAQLKAQVQAQVHTQLLVATSELRSRLRSQQYTSLQLQTQIGHLDIKLNNVKGLASVSHMRGYTTLFNHKKIHSHFFFST